MVAFPRALSPLALFFLLSIMPASAQDFESMSTAQLRSTVADSHPSAFYVLASRLFDAGEREEAVFWFYAGQLRYRTHLACETGLSHGGDAALFGALSDVIGSEINAYAFGDVDALVSTIESVIVWNAQTPDGFLAGHNCTAARETVLAGLRDLQAYVAENADEVRAQRAASGLPNR